MEIELCSACNKTGDIICFCSNIIVCTQCIGKHLIDFPSLIHKPVVLKDFHMRSLVSSS